MSAKRRADGPAVTKQPSGGRNGAPGHSRSRLRRVLKWLLIVGVVLALLGACSFVVLYNAIDIPDPNEDFEAQTTKVYYADGKAEVGQFATQNRDSIPFEEMPQTLKDAAVAAEDQTFWTNKGIDPKGILRAAFSNATGNATQGASTITQQYVKILYLTSERSLTRKVKEAVVSLKLQRKTSKEEILAGYLNTIYFGRGAYGVQAAAEAYFDKQAKDLDLRESAFLASVLNDPNDLDPADGKEAKRAVKSRYGYVLDGMAEMEAVSRAEADHAVKRLPRFPEIPVESQYGGQRGHMLKLVRDELLDLGYTDTQVDSGGLRVTTTFTRDAMAAAAQGVAEERPEGFENGQLHVASASVEVGTGALRGFYGGQDYLDSQINWAVAGGMAGSTMKAFADAAAIKDGFSLRDTFYGNSPIELPPNISVENQGNQSYGSAVNMVTATEDSINTAFIDMTDSMDNGPQKVIAMANSLGIPGNEAGRFGIPRASRDLVPTVGVALGTAVVSPINLANGYASLAAGGRRADVHVIEKVELDGNTDYEWDEKPVAVLDPDIAADVTYALQQVVQAGSGTAALALGRPVAGKTGTATNDKGQVSSSWFVGTTPQLSTAVMYVRGEGRGQLDGWLPEFFGGSYPARTWTNVMSTMSEGMEVEEFPPPVYVDGEAPDEGHAPVVTPVQPTTRPTRRTTRGPTKPPPTFSTSTPTTPTKPPTTVPPPPPTTVAPPPPPTTVAPTVPPPTEAPPPPPTSAPTESPTSSESLVTTGATLRALWSWLAGA